jgi:hypothetical protein
VAFVHLFQLRLLESGSLLPKGHVSLAMSMDSFRNPGAVLMNTKSFLSSFVPASAFVLPFFSSASAAGGSAVSLLDRDIPFAGAERHRMNSSAFGGGGADGRSSASLFCRSSWSSSSRSHSYDGRVWFVSPWKPKIKALNSWLVHHIGI